MTVVLTLIWHFGNFFHKYTGARCPDRLDLGIVLVTYSGHIVSQLAMSHYGIIMARNTRILGSKNDINLLNLTLVTSFEIGLGLRQIYSRVPPSCIMI